VHPVPIDPGEYLLADGFGKLTWTPGVGYRMRDDLDVGAFRVPPPDDGRPWAQGHTSLWLLRSGSGIVLYSPYFGVRWQHPAQTPVLVPTRDRLIYLDAGDLVAIGPPAPGRH
jgi:hypothetical protein